MRTWGHVAVVVLLLTAAVAGGFLNRIRGGWLNSTIVGPDLADVLNRLYFAVPVRIVCWSRVTFAWPAGLRVASCLGSVVVSAGILSATSRCQPVVSSSSSLTPFHL